MGHVLIRVDFPDDDESIVLFGVMGFAENVAGYASGCRTVDGFTYSVVEAVGPPGWACGICGGVTHGELICRPGRPPAGVPYYDIESPPKKRDT